MNVSKIGIDCIEKSIIEKINRGALTIFCISYIYPLIFI